MHVRLTGSFTQQLLYPILESQLYGLERPATVTELATEKYIGLGKLPVCSAAEPPLARGESTGTVMMRGSLQKCTSQATPRHGIMTVATQAGNRGIVPVPVIRRDLLPAAPARAY